MKDLTKVIDTLDSINKVMGCMKEHTYNGITIKTISTEYILDESGTTLMIDVENKEHPDYENRTFIHFSLLLDYLEVKDIIMYHYDRMCVEMRINIEKDKGLQND